MVIRPTQARIVPFHEARMHARTLTTPHAVLNSDPHGSTLLVAPYCPHDKGSKPAQRELGFRVTMFTMFTNPNP